MLYQLFTWLNQEFNVPGAGMFQFLTFRIAMAVLLSLIIATVFGKKLIEFLQKSKLVKPLESLVYRASSKKRVHQPWVVSLFC
jgi:phospho-N-acetylmuramoyl-pentapeptide-transferase